MHFQRRGKSVKYHFSNWKNLSPKSISFYFWTFLEQKRDLYRWKPQMDDDGLSILLCVMSHWTPNSFYWLRLPLNEHMSDKTHSSGLDRSFVCCLLNTFICCSSCQSKTLSILHLFISPPNGIIDINQTQTQRTWPLKVKNSIYLINLMTVKLISLCFLCRALSNMIRWVKHPFTVILK